MSAEKEFHKAQAAYNPKDVKTVDAYLEARDKALKAGYHVSSANPKNAVISATAKVRDPKPEKPQPLSNVRIADPAPKEKGAK